MNKDLMYEKILELLIEDDPTKEKRKLFLLFQPQSIRDQDFYRKILFDLIQKYAYSVGDIVISSMMQATIYDAVINGSLEDFFDSFCQSLKAKYGGNANVGYVRGTIFALLEVGVHLQDNYAFYDEMEKLFIETIVYCSIGEGLYVKLEEENKSSWPEKSKLILIELFMKYYKKGSVPLTKEILRNNKRGDRYEYDRRFSDTLIEEWVYVLFRQKNFNERYNIVVN